MADTDNHYTPQPMSSSDIETPPATTEFTPAAPLKDAGTEFTSDAKADAPSEGGIAGAKRALIDSTAELRGQAGDRARDYAEQGKTRATDALGQLSQLLTDAAGQVDEKLGEQYGQYARTAAGRVQTLSSSLNDKSLDELLDDARTLVRKSPAVAVGAAAALGFVVARLFSAGVDQRDT